MRAAIKWGAAALYAARAWWWLGWRLGRWLPPRTVWRYAHQHHDWEKWL